MRFGIYAETQCPPEKPHYDLTWEIVRQIIHADAVGFDSYFGGIEPWKAIKTQELFAKYVMPAWRE